MTCVKTFQALADPNPGDLHERLQGTYNDMKQSTLKTLTFLTYLMRTPTAPNVRPFQVNVLLIHCLFSVKTVQIIPVSLRRDLRWSFLDIFSIVGFACGVAGKS